MKRQLQNLLALILLIALLEIISSWLFPAAVRSQSTSTDTSSDSIPTEIQGFEPPPEDGEPNSTAGGGSRSNGTCLNEAEKIVLTPIRDEQVRSISISVPATSAHAVVIKIEDEHKNLVYYDTLAIETAPGTLHIHLPETTSSLEIGKPYQWMLSAICGKFLTPNDPIFEGEFIPESMTEFPHTNLESSVLSE